MLKQIKTIGNTPMIKINYEYKGKSKYIYTKLEYYNPTGSISHGPFMLKTEVKYK